VCDKIKEKMDGIGWVEVRWIDFMIWV